MYRIPPIWMVSFFSSRGHRSRESDNTPPGRHCIPAEATGTVPGEAGGEGRSEPLFDQRNRSCDLDKRKKLIR